MTGDDLINRFDPKVNIIYLLQKIYRGATVTAVGVVTCEAGYAIRYAMGYSPIKFYMSIYPVVRVGSKLSVYMIFLGIVLPVECGLVAYIGIVLYNLSVLCSVAALIIKFNANAWVLRYLEETHALTANEFQSVQKVLRVVAMAYFASL